MSWKIRRRLRVFANCFLPIANYFLLNLKPETLNLKQVNSQFSVPAFSSAIQIPVAWQRWFFHHPANKQ
jgi:hypothetical protein